MSHNISISVPYNYLAISSAAKMLSKLAEELKNEDAVETAPDRNEAEVTGPSASTTACDDQLKPEPEAKQVFAPVTDVPAPPAPPVANYSPEPEMAAEQYNDAVAKSVDDALDANGLPWDARIHAATKTKDKAGNWKYLRGVDRDVLVPEVEAELRALVGEPVEDEPAPVAAIPTPPAPAPAAETPAAETPAPPAPPVAAVTPSTSVTTFAQLVTGITANSIPEDKVSAALTAVGLQNFALLGARPDLIPTVAGHLGL